MKLKKAWGLLLVCGMIGCGGKPQAVVEEPDILQEGLEAEISELDVVEEPNAANEGAAVPEEQSQRLELGVEITNSVGMKLVLIPAGEFMMGSGRSAEALAKQFDTKAEFFEMEFPQHRVTITQPYYLGAHEVTVGQFRRFVEANGYKTEAERDGKGGYGWNESARKFEECDPKYSWRNTGFAQGDDHPVVNVTWNDAAAFCEWLSGREGHEYRLPTEAEWEYACRAGTATQWWYGDDVEGLAQVANVADATARAKFDWSGCISATDGHAFTAPVGSFRANVWGLYDMHGNVHEWCSDWYAADYYRASPAVNPKGADGAEQRVLRGGSWTSYPRSTRSAFRNRTSPVNRNHNRDCNFGFRLARSVMAQGMLPTRADGERSTRKNQEANDLGRIQESQDE